MKALTLWQPWAFLVARGYKLVENRPWTPPKDLIGERFAIHAGKRFEVGDWEGLLDVALARGISIPNRADITLGAIIGTAKLECVVLAGDALGDQRQWFAGPFGWLLSDTRYLTEPVPWKGALGLWKVKMVGARSR